MLLTAGDRINAGRFDVAVSQNIGQKHNVALQPIIGDGEQMPQVVGKDLLGLNLSQVAETFHLRPNVAAVKRFAASRYENTTRLDFLLQTVLQQFFLQWTRNQHLALLTLAADQRKSAVHRLPGDKTQLADPYPGGADGLHQQEQSLILPLLGRVKQAKILFLGQFPLGIAENLSLHFEQADTTLIPAEK